MYWNSDVCSSDLCTAAVVRRTRAGQAAGRVAAHALPRQRRRTGEGVGNADDARGSAVGAARTGDARPADRGAGFGVRGPACGAGQYPGAGPGRTSQALRLMQQGRRLAPAALSFVPQSFTARGLEVEPRPQLGQLDVHRPSLAPPVLAHQPTTAG